MTSVHSDDLIAAPGRRGGGTRDAPPQLTRRKRITA